MTSTDIALGLKLPVELHLAARKSAEDKGITLAGWIRMAMKEKLQRESASAGADEPVTRAELQKAIAEAMAGFAVASRK